MMGQTTDDLDTPIIKTTSGAVILPRNHLVIERKLKPDPLKSRIGKSACDQCRYCTEFCPRYLLGYAVEPHQVMRSLAFTATGKSYWNQMGSNLLRVRALHALCLPRITFPEGSL